MLNLQLKNKINEKVNELEAKIKKQEQYSRKIAFSYTSLNRKTLIKNMNQLAKDSFWYHLGIEFDVRK